MLYRLPLPSLYPSTNECHCIIYFQDESGFIGHTELLSLLRDIFQKEGPVGGRSELCPIKN